MVACSAVGVVASVHAWRLGMLVRPRLFTLAHQIGDMNGVSVAQKIQVLLIDDLDGSQADGTVRFALDGTEYQIDLNAEHAAALREALARYVSAARRAGGGARRPARGGRRAPVSGPNPT
jgi:DNA-binding LytR/AlgR family response regulator